MSRIYIPHHDGINLNIYVQAGASKTSFSGIYNDRLKLKVAAKAVDGEANQAVLELIADSFSVAKRSVNLIRGNASREKTIHIIGNHAELVTTIGQILANCPQSSDE